MKNKRFIAVAIAHCLLIFTQSTYTMEIISRAINTTNISFCDIPEDIQKLILKTVLNLYNIPVENITLSPKNMPICLLNINQYSLPIKIGETIFIATDMAQLTPHEKKLITKIANPSLINRLYGYSNTIISEDDYDTLSNLPANIKKNLKPIKVQSNDVQSIRAYTATTCTCGIMGLICCNYLGPYCALLSCLCLTIGCTTGLVEASVLCAKSCKHVNPGFKPERRTFS